MTLNALLVTVALLLQPTPPPPAGPDGLQASKQEVEVDAVPDDRRIERRLRSILETTGRFDDVTVSVSNGVVLLGGSVLEESERNWVADLASNTQGVVAVSNRVAIAESSVWDFSPAVQELEHLWRQFVASLPRLLAGLIILVLVTLSATRVARGLSGPLARKWESELIRSVISKAVAVFIWLFGVYLFLRVAGLTQVALTIVGGTGILGLVIGFAFRDIAENFLASVLISLQRPFRYGDTIEVVGHTGIVQRVTPRGTILMDFDGNYIQIANAQVYKNTIKNFTANPNVRQDFSVGIGYDAGVSHAQEIVLQVLEGHSAVLEDPRPLVLVEKLASATVNLRVYFWVDGVKHSKLKVRSALMRMVLGALSAEGVSMPGDTLELTFPDGVPVRMLDRDEPVSPADRPADDHDSAERESRDDDRHDEATDAEGDLSSESPEINAQAKRSRPPEEGADVMAR